MLRKNAQDEVVVVVLALVENVAFQILERGEWRRVAVHRCEIQKFGICLAMSYGPGFGRNLCQNSYEETLNRLNNECRQLRIGQSFESVFVVIIFNLWRMLMFFEHLIYLFRLLFPFFSTSLMITMLPSVNKTMLPSVVVWDQKLAPLWCALQRLVQPVNFLS